MSALDSILLRQITGAGLPPDSQPPLLELLGPATVTLQIGAPFRDPGASAVDSRDPAPSVTTLGLPELLQALEAAAVDPSSLGPATVDGLHGPWLLLYSARDAAGNVSPSVSRSVFIDSRCPGSTMWCPQVQACVDGLCLPAAVAAVLGGSAAPTAAQEYFPPVDTEPPRLLLEVLPGDERVASSNLPAEISAIVYTRWELDRGPFDGPGCQAEDDVDGNLTAVVSRSGLAEVQAAVLSGTPTEEDSPLLIRYLVSDSAGNTAQALRAVWLVCPVNEHPCLSVAGERVCTIEGVCVGKVSVGQVAGSQGGLQMELLGDAVVFVPQGAPYFRCARRQPLHILCDQVCRLLEPSCVPVLLLKFLRYPLHVGCHDEMIPVCLELSAV